MSRPLAVAALGGDGVSQLELSLTHSDMVRMGKQRREVFEVMLDGRWWSLHEIAATTGHPEASISARLRDFRRPKYGGHTVERRRRHGPDTGTWEYRLEVRPC